MTERELEIARLCDLATGDVRRELVRAANTLARIRFLLGGSTNTTDDCDDAAVRYNAQQALQRVNEYFSMEDRHADR